MHIHRLVGIAVLFIGISHASSEPEKGSTTLVVSGNAAAHSREVAASAIEKIARDTGAPITNASFTAKEITTIRGCVTAPRAWNCVVPVVQNKGLQQLLVFSLANDTSTDGSPMVVVTGQVLAAHMDAAVSDQRFCVRCTDDVLVNVTSELMHSLFQESETRAGRTVVRIKSVPRGARIVFDGRSMGATDRSFNTFQGKHTVALELDGYRRESRTIEAALDRTSELSVTMRPITMSVAGHHDAERCEGSLPGSPPSGTLAPKLVMATGARGGRRYHRNRSRSRSDPQFGSH